MQFKISFVSAFIASGLVLGACAGVDQTSTELETSPVAESPIASPSPTQATANNHDDTVSQGGQVIESGPYHLELVTLPEAGGTHLDFYLQKGDTHEAIPNAKVTAQVQLPDGAQETLDMPYDAQGEHYAVLLPVVATGDYKVVILSEINGEKVNGRFAFTK